MMKNISSLIVLIVSNLLLLGLSTALIHKKGKKSQVQIVFGILLILMIIWSFSLILQIIFQNSQIDPFTFEKFAAFGACFIPVTVMIFGIVFAKTKINFKPVLILLYVIPIISTILMFTNDSHHLMYEHYSLYFRETIFGKYFPVHSIYSYSCILIGIVLLIRYMVKNSGFFSKQSLLIITGVFISLIINLLATLGIFNLNVYATPISFAFAFVFFALAIFKFDFLKIAPIALQRIVDRISDSYIVVNESNIITDFNQTFLDLFNIKSQDIRNKSMEELFNKYNKKFGINKDLILNSIEEAKKNQNTIVLEESLPSIKKFFHIEINSITSKNIFLGVLILLKDITQHINDMQTIQENQDMLIEKERLASLGQMIGGIAHNLKTPIMSIAGATEGLADLIKEYDLSIGDPEVTFEDHHNIAKDMFEWVSKIKTHTSYMSDVITAVKGQAVALSSNVIELFTIEELIKSVNILMKHELKNALIELNYSINVPSNFELKGNINSLIQVINNMISNSIQSYDGKKNQSIDLIISKQNNNIIISVKDYGPGLPDQVKQKLFKEMITTKGKNGTGLGLFMSYSNIRAHFNGNITFESEKGKGTQFNIILPIEQ